MAFLLGSCLRRKTSPEVAPEPKKPAVSSDAKETFRHDGKPPLGSQQTPRGRQPPTALLIAGPENSQPGPSSGHPSSGARRSVDTAAVRHGAPASKLLEACRTDWHKELRLRSYGEGKDPGTPAPRRVVDWTDGSPWSQARAPSHPPRSFTRAAEGPSTPLSRTGSAAQSQHQARHPSRRSRVSFGGVRPLPRDAGAVGSVEELDVAVSRARDTMQRHLAAGEGKKTPPIPPSAAGQGETLSRAWGSSITISDLQRAVDLLEAGTLDLGGRTVVCLREQALNIRDKTRPVVICNGTLRLRGIAASEADGAIGQRGPRYAVAVSCCSSLVIEDVTIEKTAGYGLLIERSCNVTLSRVRVASCGAPEEQSEGRHAWGDHGAVRISDSCGVRMHGCWVTETAGGAESVALQLLPSCTLSMADTRIEDSAGVGAFVGAGAVLEASSSVMAGHGQCGVMVAGGTLLLSQGRVERNKSFGIVAMGRGSCVSVQDSALAGHATHVEVGGGAARLQRTTLGEGAEVGVLGRNCFLHLADARIADCSTVALRVEDNAAVVGEGVALDGPCSVVCATQSTVTLARVTLRAGSAECHSVISQGTGSLVKLDDVTWLGAGGPGAIRELEGGIVQAK